MLPLAFAILALPISQAAKLALGQSPADQGPSGNPAQFSASPPVFEVATVKEIAPETPHMVGIDVFPDRLEVSGFTLKTLIGSAFDVATWQVRGGSDWATKVEFTIVGKLPDVPKGREYDLRHSLFHIDDPRIRLMLQSLLLERFRLATHPDNSTGQIYLLEKTGRPIQLKPTVAATKHRPYGGKGFAGSIGFAGGEWVIYNTSMAELAQFAGDMVVQRPVVDRTGIDGSFDYRWTVEDGASDTVTAFYDTFEDLLKQIGLKLSPARGPVETIVIDHAEKPSPN
jgi:uncharacterized protein (TIGR03435 family)